MDYKTVIKKIKKDIGDVSLMAVSKTRTLDEIKAVYESGITLFGENHVQEIVEKFSNWHPADVKVHMIGHLQSNKVGKVVPLVDMIESIDSIDLLKKVDNAACKCNKVIDVLLEMNTSGEDAKSGFESEDAVIEALNFAQSLSNVKVRGLMTVGPVDCPAEEKDLLTEKAFKRLSMLYYRCKENFTDFDVLSMGMSQDYIIAVKCNSTQVRIGTLIFGERFYG